MLAGVYKSYGDSLSSLWSDETGRFIFRSTMSLKHFFMLSRAIRFEKKETRSQRRPNDNLAPIRDLGDKWVKNQKIRALFIIDEQLLGCRGKCAIIKANMVLKG